MLTLLETSKLLINDTLQRGVIETFARTSPVLELLPFMEINGGAYKYNVEDSLPNSEFRGVGESYSGGEGNIVQGTESLVILGGISTLDRFVQKTMSNVTDQRALRTEMYAKSVAKTFTKSFFDGDSATDSKQFDGLNKRLAGTSQEIYADDEGIAGANLTLTKLHELLDAVEGGADVLFMSKSMRRELQAILGESTHYIENGSDAFGRPVQVFAGVPIRVLEDEILPFGETVGSETKAGSIYAVKFGAEQYVSGLRNGGVEVEDLGLVETQYKTLIEFYCGLAVFHPKAVARLAGITKRPLAK